MVAATLVDVLGTAALVTTSDSGGVSLALSTHYLRGVPAAGLVLVDAQVRLGTAPECPSLRLFFFLCFHRFIVLDMTT